MNTFGWFLFVYFLMALTTGPLRLLMAIDSDSSLGEVVAGALKIMIDGAFLFFIVYQAVR